MYQVRFASSGAEPQQPLLPLYSMCYFSGKANKAHI